MGSVYRNGNPPKGYHHKIIKNFEDWNFSEEQVANWMRINCTGNVQYDVIVFQGSEKFRRKTFELTVWFQKAQDSKAFQEKWGR